MTPSCWNRAGMAGIETGIDLTAAMARLEPDVDAHAVRLLLCRPVEGLPLREAPDGDEQEKPVTMSPETAAMATMAARRRDLEPERRGDGEQE